MFKFVQLSSHFGRRKIVSAILTQSLTELSERAMEGDINVNLGISWTRVVLRLYYACVCTCLFARDCIFGYCSLVQVGLVDISSH